MRNSSCFMDAFCCCFKVQEELEDDINNSNNQHHSSSNGFTNFVSKFATLFRNNETQHVPSRVACFLTEEAKTKAAKNIVEVEECPVCLEEYTTENPKIPMKCSHNYHLACIYEWLERSNFCPICDRVMEFEESLDAQMR